MSVSTHDEVEEVDLSKLISFGMAFEPLQLTLRDILRRLAQLERQNTTQDDRIAQLTSTVDDLEAANKALEAKVAEVAAKAEKSVEGGEEKEVEVGSDNDAIWDEIARLNGLLGELQDGAERDRHTIDEIYAARKRHPSISAGAAAVEDEDEDEDEDAEENDKELEKPTQQRLSAKEVEAPKPDRTTTAASNAGGAPARKQSVARPLRTTEESAPTKPVGDVILDRAREDLHLDGTHVYTAFAESASTVEDAHLHDGGDSHRASSVAPTPSRGSAAAASGVKGVLPPPPPPQQQQTSAQPSRPQSVSINFASRPVSGGAGGEDAGEHRGSVAFAVAPASRPASHAQRRSIYADQRITAAAARRASQFSGAQSTEAGSPSASVFDKLRRDGDDIAYLNRVVAEILGQMKDLHADVKELRTSQDVEGEEAEKAAQTTESAAVPPPTAATAEELEEVRRRLARVEGDVVDTRQQLQHRDDGLQEELDDLKRQLRVARSLTDDDLDALRNVRDLTERVRQLEERLRALEAAHGALSDQFASVLAVGEKSEGGASDINPLQFAALQGAVKNLEKQLADLLAAQGGQQDWSEQIHKLTEAVRAVEGDVEAVRDQQQRTTKEVSRLDEVKANRSELPDPSLLAGNNSNDKRRSSAESAAVADLAGRMARAETTIHQLNEEKADRTALQKLRDDLAALRQLVEAANAQRGSGGSGDSGASRAALAALEKALRETQTDVNNLKDAVRAGGAGVGGEDVEDLRNRIERLDHCKADAILVANKAERDYVENALERLMREVEQVLNATNAGLIDTLEKSLNILRDMIDGKATKQDVANLQGWVAESSGGAGAGGGGGGAADGLTGFKGFRCLGCNRPMDNMRPRTLPATMTPFLNRNPQNFPQDNVTRTIQQQQQRAGGLASTYGGGARPATVGSPDASLHRSTNSEPLPPIEPS